jgi:putative addiction module component (TIGR02574 family)
MSRRAAEILKDALTLPAEARAAIADSLLESLDTEIDPDAESAWREEIVRRAKELDSKEVRTVPWTVVNSRLKSVLGDDR